MTTIGADNRPLRVLYLGTPGAFSRAPLLALLDAGFVVCGVVIPAEHAAQPAIVPLVSVGARSPLPIANPYLTPTIVHTAWERGIPAFAAARLDDPATRATIADLRPDIACVACFPRRIPATLLRLAPLGWLNVHPSLLPAYRGPAPIFWALRNGETSIGVTVHFMDEDFDTGEIAAQAPLALPEGAGGAQADDICAALGAQLLVKTLRDLQRGALVPRRQAPGGTYYGWPREEDWTISVAWPARRAFNFMRATDDWRHPYRVETGGARLVLISALSYAAGETLGAPYLRGAGEVAIQCTPGVLRAR
ncbi:MAG: methionyl-tRNA formyltransferase [Roseiflexaceae bacterium]